MPEKPCRKNIADKGMRYYSDKRRKHALHEKGSSEMSFARDLRGISFNFGIWMVIAGLCLIGWQVYEFIQFGSWVLISLAAALEWVHISANTFPADWFDVYKVLKQTPLSLVLIACGIASVWWSI